jgi:hypothetical protein
MVGHLLGDFEFASGFQIGGEPGRTKAVPADLLHGSRGLGASLHPVHVGLSDGQPRCQLPAPQTRE